MYKFSIVVCCYNSVLRLPETIKYLSNLKIDGFKAEVIIVDNASKDDTADVALKEWEKYAHINNTTDFKVIFEPSPGLSSARIAGAENATGNYVVYVDDDNWLEDVFFINAVRLIKKYPDGGVFGGLGTPYFENGIEPDWFEELKGNYAVGPQADHEGDVTFTRGFVYGASSIWEKSTLLKIINQPLLLSDRKGSKLTSGGDTELCLRAIIAGRRIIYSDTLKFTHFIPANRLNREYVERMHKDSLEGNLLLQGLMYKANVFPEMSDSSIKRTWQGQIIIQFVNFLKGKLSFKQFKGGSLAYLKLRNNYNKAFK
jgi:glycosyltransferase involved in cell wall biosynthesis